MRRARLVLVAWCVGICCLAAAPAALALPGPIFSEVAGSPFATGGTLPLSIAFSPGGGLLAAANSTSNTVTVFAVDASGVLTPVAGSPFVLPRRPYSLAFSPSGALLVVANSANNNVSVLSVSGVGAATAISEIAGSPFPAGPTPLAVAFSSNGRLVVSANSGNLSLSNRIVLALSSNRFYSLRGVRPGARLAAAARKLHTGAAIHVGLNDWYMARNGPSTAVLKVRRGIVEEIGIADVELTDSRSAQVTFITSF